MNVMKGIQCEFDRDTSIKCRITKSLDKAQIFAKQTPVLGGVL